MAEVRSRDELQLEAANLWLESDRVNSLLLGTGFGKSRVCMLILERLFNRGELNINSKILLLSDSEDLRDNNWKADFDKWGFGWMWKYIQSECYQTAYKWEGTVWDLIIADEIDFSLTDNYKRAFTSNKAEMILGLTGYVDPDKVELLNEIAPPLMEYTTSEAQDDGILNKTQLVLVYYDLSRNKKDIKVEYKKGTKTKSFHQSENDAYDYLENQCESTLISIRRLRRDQDVILGIHMSKIEDLKKLEMKYKMLTRKRKELLYRGIGARATAKSLIAEVLKNPKNKILTFSMYTDQADSINEFTFHGKNKKGNKCLAMLSSGDIRSAGVCKAVNRGKNLEGVNNLIMESFDGSKTQFTQRHGRGCRLEADKKMFLYILLPHFHKQIDSPDVPGTKVRVRRPTQMVTWAKEMIGDFDFENPIKITRAGNEWQ